MSDVTITRPDDARECYRHKGLSQALYDDGEVVMGDVVINLHGDEHRQRRRLENRLFRRDTFFMYEREYFPEVIKETLHPYLSQGRSELVSLGHQLMMNLAAVTAGVDRPLGTPEESFHLYDYLTSFIDGATLAHYTGDKEAKKIEIQENLEAFDREFIDPGVSRRQALLKSFKSGDLDEEELPKDVLMVLLRNQDKIPLSRESIRREIAFFLLAGAHTSATAFTRVIHYIFKWLEVHPEDSERVGTDRIFLQRATHETIRLQPSSPVAARWVLEDTALKSGLNLSKGDRVLIDLERVNRNKDLFGEDAESFNPDRELSEGVSPWGLSFGHGMHACIGQDLAAGLVFAPGETEEEHLFGLVPISIEAMFFNGCRPDPENPPEMDDSTTRPYFGKYPVIFS
jgi:cytochrome P450